ncbi:HAMP domain-containing histidine kinase [Hymenobacter aerilatus]|uniref:histidine kinase n=1 Tax=Hymenobacter aerilatus TaxID=2932251 RepID=A0A8T9SPA4_9BACT|nr:HAMP domain-containing sensor histidine kinase [Hymenobacter aerilatus]UOR03635.1 HAMP domain-containing histidine kinase [Hymenobacter aerilatus]
MTIRNRLALQFTLLVGLLLGGGLGMVYYLSWQNTRKLYEQRLQERAYTAATLYLEADEQSPASIERVRKRFQRNLNEEVVSIYDDENRVRFGTQPNEAFTPALLAQVRRTRYVRQHHGQEQLVGVYYHDNQGNFCIMVTAVDRSGQQRLAHLRLVSVGVLLLGMLLSFVLGRWFARTALAPISQLVHRAQRVGASDLQLNLPTPPPDELGELSATLDLMLQRLKHSFEQQQSFINNASHELRTPLTAMIGELEITLARPRSADAYADALRSALADAHKLKEIISRLLQLAQLGSGEAQLPEGGTIRLDEVLFEACEEATLLQEDDRVRITLGDLPEDAALLTVPGDRHLFRLALSNLIDNACKFSEGPVLCSLAYTPGQVTFAIADNGIGIAPADLQHVRQTFFRAANAHGFRGYGVGLALAANIFSLHGASLEIESELHKGTTMRVVLAV